MPRYEFVEGSSSKFWEIELSGSSFTVTYGKIGSKGRTSSKSFPSAAAAKKEYDKLVASKVKKGYELVGDDEDGDDDDEAGPTREVQSNPALEQAILDVLGDESAREPWLVYADWLQAQDDPRGTLIAAQAEGGDGADILAAHPADLVGPFGSEGKYADLVELSWHMGYWRRARVAFTYDTAEELEGQTLGGILARLLAHPSARFLYQLDVGLPETVTDGESDWQPSIDAIAERVRPSIRKLFLGDFVRVDDTEISWTSIGNSGALWAALPNLTAFKVHGCGIELGEIVAPKLRSLVLWSGGLPAEPVLAIGRATLPQLEELELWFGDDNYGAECTPEHLAGILDGGGLPALRRLGLMNGQFADALPALLAASPLLPRLESLDLSMGTMSDDGGRALVANAAKFRHLKSLSLAENGISDGVAAEIKAALPQAEIGEQKDGDDVYVSVAE